ncbi:MAG TPA: tetratricopeptide repeat protein [Terriglobia bacterium]|nr:tetratricopeptide repeat protein [Terriglobia bacterium]
MLLTQELKSSGPRRAAGRTRAGIVSVILSISLLAGNAEAAVRTSPQSANSARKNSSEDNIFARGCELLLQSSFDPAAQVFKAGIERYPASSRLRLGLGIALYSRGIYDPAVDAFIKASDLAPQDARPYQFLASISGLVPEKAPAVTERLHRFAESAPDDAQAQYDYALSLWKTRHGPSGEAAAKQIQPLLERAIRLNPNFADAHLQLGLLFSDQHEDREAAAEYRQAIAANSGLAEAHYHLGQALARLGESSQANQQLQTYERLHPEPASEADHERQEIRQFVLAIRAPAAARPTGNTKTSTAGMSITYSDSADLKPGGLSGSVDAGGYSSQTQARGSELRQALGTLAPGAPAQSEGKGADGAESIAFQRASKLLLGGDYREAATAFRQQAVQFPGSARMVLGLGVADYSRGRYAQAIDALCKAVDLSPDQPQAYFFLAQAYSASPANADAVLKRVANYASSQPENAAARYYYALCLWRSRGMPGQAPADPKQVEQLLRSAISLDPALAEAHFELGVVFADQGHARQAAPEFARAAALDPQWAEAHYRLGQAYRQAGESDKARSELEESERLRKSGDTEAQRLRAEIRRFLTPRSD